MTHPLRLWLLVAGLFVCTEGFGQTMYRCGNKYQDRPCDAGQKGRAVGSTGVDSGPAPGAAPGAGGAGAARLPDAQCAQLGQDALKIMWSREGGASQERLESEAKTGRERNLVRDVYRRRGSASQVQAAVEADCVAEKDRAAQAAALEAAAARLRAEQREVGSGSSIESRPESRPPSAAEIQAVEQQRAQTAADRDAERKKRVCAGLNTDMGNLSTRERRGGSAGTMDALREERRSLQSQMSSHGC